MFDDTNIYALRTEIVGGITRYYVSFQDGQAIMRETEISRPIYLEFLRFIKRERNLRRWNERHTEQSELTGETLYNRALRTQKSVDEMVFDSQWNEQLRKAVVELPKTQRRRFVLYHEFGLTYEQIAEMEGCTKMPVKRSIDRAMIRKRADGRWEARYTDTRETDPQKRVKYITNKSQKVVVEKLKAALAEVDAGVPILANNNSTVGEWLLQWLREYKISELRDGTYETYEGYINRSINPLIGHIRLKDLVGQHIQQMYNKLQEAKKQGGYGLSGATVVKIKNILSGALEQAVINRIIRY